jgi:hypothetical protein
MNVYTSALNEKEKGNQFPFVIFYNADNKIIGSTRYRTYSRSTKN